MDTTLSTPTGQLLNGRYLVESRLAQGGMATVYLGRDTRLDRIVALKVARPPLAADPEFVRRFATEARAVAQLSSPHVVAIYDQGSAGPLEYIVMEYVPGPTLREVLNARGALRPQEALDIIEGVLAGLDTAHRVGIIHRDVKPENVLLGAEGVVKVADFGLARAAAAASSTTTGMIIGTAAYLAPEQVSGGRSDARSDVYAAGVLLFEMLTGVQPHTGESPLAVAYKHVSHTVPAPSSLVAGVPPALDMIVALATSRDPALRPPDAGQFLNAISELRGGPPAARRGQHAAPGREPEGGSGLRVVPGSPPALPPADPFADTDLRPIVPLRDGGLAADYRGINHTLIVPASTFVPGFRDDSGRRRRGQDGWHDREPRLQRLLFSRRLLYIVAALAVAGVVVLLAWWLAAGRYTTVPQLDGRTVSAARAELTGRGFTVRENAGRHSDEPRGSVVVTSPRAGSRVRKDISITLTPSLGPVEISVPAVTGVPLQQAEAELQAKGLTYRTPAQATSTTIAAGVVISTQPTAGVFWPKDQPVTITVSAGPPLPSFVGGPLAAAQAAAQVGGYQINPETDARGSQPAGTITGQSPAAGSALHSGEVVVVHVSPGPPEVNVPDVQGMSSQQAQSALTQAGFKVTVDKHGFGNHVTGYSPQGQEPQGSVITINVGFSFF